MDITFNTMYRYILMLNTYILYIFSYTVTDARVIQIAQYISTILEIERN